MAKVKKQKDKVCIVGFAPDTRLLAPIEDDSFDLWGLNELYMEMPQVAQRASAWFQLHGFEPPTVRDPEQAKHLGDLNCPVYLWKEHRNIPNSVEYPREEILEMFDTFGKDMAHDMPNQRDRAYFTNSISWMIAMAIYKGYKEIHVYGVNMAQDQEYQHQRPSCEWFLGYARGAGIKVYVPPAADLCKSWMLYGYDDGSVFMQKAYARIAELDQRLNGLAQQQQQGQNQVNEAIRHQNQLVGAKENMRYIINLGPRGVVDDVSGAPQNDQNQPPEV